MADQNLKYTITVDEKGAIKSIKSFEKSGTKSTKNIDKGFTKLSKTSKKTTTSMAKHWKALGGIILASFAFTKIIKGMKSLVDAASDLQEVTGKFEVVFRGQMAVANEFAKVLVDSYAMSTREAREYLSSIQDLLVPMGVAADTAANLSNEVVKLAADLGSFNNLPTKKVIDDMQSALVGNYETMKKYGVVLKATTVEQKALAMGFAATKKALTTAHKAQAAYKLILEGSKAAIGDMGRTMGNYANQVKQLNANLENLRAKLGTALIGPLTIAVTKINEWIKANEDLLEQEFAEIIDDLTGALIKFADALIDAKKWTKENEIAWDWIVTIGGYGLGGLIGIAAIRMLGLGSMTKKAAKWSKSLWGYLKNVNTELKTGYAWWSTWDDLGSTTGEPTTRLGKMMKFIEKYKILRKTLRAGGRALPGVGILLELIFPESTVTDLEERQDEVKFSMKSYMDEILRLEEEWIRLRKMEALPAIAAGMVGDIRGRGDEEKLLKEKLYALKLYNEEMKKLFVDGDKDKVISFGEEESAEKIYSVMRGMDDVFAHLITKPGEYTKEELEQIKYMDDQILEMNAEKLSKQLAQEAEAKQQMAAMYNNLKEGIADSFTSVGMSIRGVIQDTMEWADVIENTLNSLSDAFMQYAMDMIKAQYLMKLAGIVVSGISGAWGSAGTTAVGGNTIRGGEGGGYGFAKGGIAMGGFRPFANGGIADRPTMGLVGEGGMNEAVVPLPDGKSIPVTGGGGTTNIIIQALDSQSFFDAMRRNPEAIINVISEETDKGNNKLMSSINRAGSFA